MMVLFLETAILGMLASSGLNPCVCHLVRPASPKMPLTISTFLPFHVNIY